MDDTKNRKTEGKLTKKMKRSLDLQLMKVTELKLLVAVKTFLVAFGRGKI